MCSGSAGRPAPESPRSRAGSHGGTDSACTAPTPEPGGTRDRALRAGNAAALRWEAMSPEERLLSPPEEMLELSLHRERGSMVVDDLRALPSSPLVVAEGSPLPAWALAERVAERARSVWLIPTRAFQGLALRGRDRRLYRLLRETIEQEARAHGARTLAVDGSRSIEQTVTAVEDLFGAALAEGPCAGSPAERRSLLREANRAVADQVLDLAARPWADPAAATVDREFACECGDPGCEAGVIVEPRTAASRPAFAPGHAPPSSGRGRSARRPGACGSPASRR
jgi:hypothetical protein